MMLYHVLPGGGLKPCDALPPTHIQIHNCATFTLYLPATLVTPRMEAPFYGLIWGDAIVDVASAPNFVDAVKHFHAPLWRFPHQPEPAAEKRVVRRRVTKKVPVAAVDASDAEGSDAEASEADASEAECDADASESAVEEDEDDASLVQDESEDDYEEEEEGVEFPEGPVSPEASDVESEEDV